MTARRADKPTFATGLSRSVSLLRALGAQAAPVWAELDQQDADKISAAMATLPAQADAGEEAASTLLQEAELEAGRTRSIWDDLSALDVAQLADLLADEHPQVIALTLSRIAPLAAARLVRQFPALLATEVLRRMLHMNQVNTAAIAAIERNFETRLAALASRQSARPDETVARIFDALSDGESDTLLRALHAAEPGMGERIRGLMLSFTDLANLSPAGLQTLLSRADRTKLTLAQKAAPAEVTAAFYANMTARAGELLREEITALGPRPRSEVEAARADLVSLTRKLMDAGEINPAGAQADEDLIE